MSASPGVDALREVRAQDHAVGILRAALARGKLASAYLFEGPSGVGKSLAAEALARTVVAAGSTEVDRRIAQGAHPDVRLFRPRDEGDRNLQVSVVRGEVLPFAQFAPFEATHAFLIFPEADVSFPESHPEAANAMLKTIEEPRPGVHFVLLAERPDRLLATIRSRCQRVRFSRLPDDVVEGILAERGVAPEARQAAVALAGGRADLALTLAEGGLADTLLGMALRCDEAAASGRAGAMVQAVEELSRFEPIERALDALALYYRDVAAAALGRPDASLAFRHRAGEIRARAAQLGAARAAHAAELLRELDEQLDQNANREIALGAVLASIG
ncbi:MAG: AAA family ATPase [Sandaracinus sp.]